MPTYDYECPKCGHRFEKFQEISAKPLKTCPKCKSRRLRRLIGTGAGILFKGSGFHKTDYRSESFKKEAKKEAGEGSTQGAAADSKPGKKKETKGGTAKPSSE
jgi:putative FmdB family regulatory protein